jgi:hypothetical protein
MKRIIFIGLMAVLIAHSAWSTETQVIGAGSGVEGGGSFEIGEGLFLDAVLNNVTGNEVALTLNYLTSKATSGNDTGLVINQTDTLSPGTSLLLDAQVGGITKFNVDNTGKIVTNDGIEATGVIEVNTINARANDSTMTLMYTDFTAADTALDILAATDVTNSSGQFNGVAITPTYAQSGTAEATDLLINRTQTSVGSGEQNLIDAQVGGASKFRVDNNGVVTVNGDLVVTGESTVKPHAGSLGYEDVIGFFEDYSTADIFYKWQDNIATSESFGNVSSSITDASISILTGGAGLYEISRNTGMHGQPETGYSFAIFKNETAIAESHTSPGAPNEVDPFFINLSSYGGDAVYGTNSTIDFLFHADKDQLHIVEGNTGNGANQWCFELEAHFNVDHIPHVLFLGNTRYDGGAGHFADALAFDNLSSKWNDLRLATGDIVHSGGAADYKNENIAFAFPNGGNETRYVSSNIVKVLIRHNDSVVCSSGHEIFIDKASVEDLLGARSDSDTIIIRLNDGDKITVREKPNLANKFFHRHKTRLNVTRIGD